MPIRVLRPDVAAKIAAGEVIERPASVVKELIENSLDAGAGRIAVEIAGGGTETIRVLDDGRGIPAGEVELAFRRFATSKVTILADLEAIRSLGFRGEALASIAAVSRVVLVTKTGSAEAATEVEVEEGGIVRVGPAGAADGTSVTVRDLFASFPARRKFLSSASAEASRVRTLVQRYALAYPAVAFEMTVDGKKAVSTSGSGALLDAVAQVYTPAVAAEMIPVEGGRPGVISVTGLAGAPTVSRSTRAHIGLFVNGRWIHPGSLGHAVEQAYHGFMGDRRHPVVVLNIQIDPADLDVNVHPAKVEVRFRRAREVFGELQRAVREALTQQAPVPQMGAPEGRVPVTMERSGAMWTSTLTRTEGPSEHAARAAATGAQGRALHAPMASVLPAMRVLGQSQLTYIVAEGPDGVYLFDQHAAHERVLYERIAAESGAAASQALLVPVEIDLSDLEPEVGDALVSAGEILADAGFEIEPFGPMAYRLTALPAAMGVDDPAGGLIEALRDMCRSTAADRRESLVRRIACHGSVRAGMKMSKEEMEELVRLLEACSNPHSCPHGRPTTLHLSEARLEREFGRS